jgi:tryptophan synthase beta chain
MHQPIIGLYTKKQFELVDYYPDIVVISLGGVSNFGGFAIPFLADAIKKKKATRFIAAQTAAAPNLTEGKYEYDFGDVAKHTPLLKMYTLGHKKEMPPVRGDGLRYHAAAPILSLLREQGFVEAKAYPIDEKHVFERAGQFIQSEGFIPAPESAYSIAAAIDEALEAKKTGTAPVIAFNISGHGFLDMQAYADALLPTGQHFT